MTDDTDHLLSTDENRKRLNRSITELSRRHPVALCREEELRRVTAVIADKIECQATCLEGYAKDHGFEAEPIPSVFHLQAAHFRTYANELREAMA